MKLLVLQKCSGADYLQDLFNHYLLTLPDTIEIDYIDVPAYLFDDFPDISSIRGNGFTIYGKLPSASKPALKSRAEILAGIKTNLYESIIYPSVRRCSIFYNLTIRYYEQRDIITLDGQDDIAVSLFHSLTSTYYKRELVGIAKFLARPISFSFPSVNLPSLDVRAIQKRTLLAECQPCAATYLYTRESDYYQAYQDSFFALTTKKGGWDCLRHYEILANGSLPLFPDVGTKPSHTMADFPLHLQIMTNKLFAQLNNALPTGSLLLKYQNLLYMYYRYFKAHLVSDVSYDHILLAKPSRSSLSQLLSYILLLPVLSQNLYSSWHYGALRETIRVSIRSLLINLKLYRR